MTTNEIIYDTLKNENVNYDFNDDENENDDDYDYDYDYDYDEEVPIHEITTYEEWITCNNISKVIITNKKTGEGYIRFNGGLWRKLYNRNSLDYDNNNMENLSEFIEYNQKTVYRMIKPIEKFVHRWDKNINLMYSFENNFTKQIISYYDFKNLNKSDQKNYSKIYTFINVEYDEDKIYKDIIKKCYVNKKNCEFYDLNYHTYVFPIYVKEYVNDIQREIKPVIFNSLNFTFNSVDELVSNKILTSDKRGMGTFYVNNNNIDINIVDDILNSLINHDIKLEYKKLLYNLIVKKDDEQITFYDFNERLLTTWANDLLDSITKNNNYIYSSGHYENISQSKKDIKKYKPRFVIIDTHNFSIEKQKKDFSKLGINIFIVHKNDKQNTMYNLINFRNYLQDNKDILINILKNQHNFEYTKDWKSYIEQNDDLIFYKSELFLTNFLKWCCINDNN
jgi:hypothetical protein